MFTTTDTIVAIATASGRGGVGIVRLSGPDAVGIATRLLRLTRALAARRATLATVFGRDESDLPIDRVLVTWFSRPASYTGDDVVELSAHGSPLILRQIVARALDEGARLAEPGEFTLRAYLNGRIDLVQAEAVADLVEAVTPLQARAAYDQLDGTLTRLIAAIDRELFDLAARLEASLDFPDEGFHFILPAEVAAALESIGHRLERLARQGRRGRLIREGATVVIAGRPNAGKSSLFNALIGTDRAIVTEIPGTTRDLLTERIDLEGLDVTLVDTAGLREASDAIEAEGVHRARRAQEAAQLVLQVIDGSIRPVAGEPGHPDTFDLRDNSAATRIVVVTKSDVPAAWAPDERMNAVHVSARTGDGLDGLRRRMVAVLTGEVPERDTPAISNLRHLRLVDAALASVKHATMTVAEGGTEELVLAELSAARVSLEAIVGRRSPDDLLTHIFERFCIGK